MIAHNTLPKLSFRFNFAIVCALAALAMLGVSADAQGVIINEIFYHPNSTNTLEEWFEIYNSSSTNVNLAGWTVSKGVAFSFPTNATVAAGGYLVVAADETTFKALHPQVTNFVASWRGALRDNGEQLELQDATGGPVNSVYIAPEGDWAVRRLGAPDQYNKVGWEWFAEHDGLGKSAELRNPRLPNDNGQNWASSIQAGGTPGTANSTLASNIPPLITGVRHFPAIPKSSDAVTITARLIDENTSGLTLVLHWRLDGQPSFALEPMLDDGAHGDGLANDRLFGIRLPAQAEGTIVEFFLTATDAEGNSRIYPNVVSSGGARTANLLYQVDNKAYSGTEPIYRLIMSKAEYDYLKGIWSGAADSDAEVSGTWVTIDGVVHDGAAAQVRYNASFRNRGHGSRTAVPHNFHVYVPKDHLWQDREGINLNTQNTASQMLGSLLMRRIGLPMPESRAVRVRVNGEDLAAAGSPQFGSYVANELMNGDYIARQNPDDPNGNLYRGMRDTFAANPGRADLNYHGPSFTSYTNAYFKENNRDRNDWSDLIHLLDVLNNTSDAAYPDAVRAVADTEEWMRYFAINTLMDNQETTLATGSGDDIALYRGVIDPRFELLPYDMDSILGRGTRTTTYADGLFRMTGGGSIPALERFVTHPDFAPHYYRELLDLAETTFAPAKLNPVLDQVGAAFSAPTILEAIDNMKAFNVSHLNYVLGLIPTHLIVTNTLSLQNGYAHTTSASMALGGRAHAARTRHVRVNGALAVWSAWEAQWGASNVALRPGLNRITVESLDEAGYSFETAAVDIWYDDGSVAAAPTTISANTSWSAAGGPYTISSGLSIANGVTLTILPGTTVYLGSGANLTVATGGRLVAEGTADAPVRFTRAPGATPNWGGVVINGDATSPETRIRFAHFEFNGSTAIHSQGGTLFFERLTFGSTDRQYLSLDGSSFVVRDCVFPSGTTPFELAHGTGGVKAGGHGLFLRNFFGATQGYSDVVDFTGGQRGADPIVEFINNVFVGSSDDILDLDGTDAWVEGNIFMHAHKNGSPDSSSAVSGGNDSGHTSEVTVIGNLFFDVDQAATAKQGNYYVLLNNTIVHQSKVGGLDTAAGVFNFADDATAEAAGMDIEGNVIADIESLTRNLTAATVTLTNNILPVGWAGSGGRNLVASPLLRHMPAVAETQFTNWQAAQIVREWLSLNPGSPAYRSGPDGRDLGGVGPIGVSISGAPSGITNSSSATLVIGTGRRGQGIPTGGYPNGAGYTDYKWRLDGGPWSAETPIETPVVLNGLAPGEHFVEAVGKRDSGRYQDDPLYGPDAVISSSGRWMVDPIYVPPSTPAVVLNEVLAKNLATFTSGETTPDLIELRNISSNPVDLSGVGLSDDSANPYKFTFPANTTLGAGEYLVLIADSDLTTAGTHLNFSLSQEGESIFLSRAVAAGGGLLDSITFGPQIPDFSIGRLRDGSWGLCRPTFGSQNVAVETGDPHSLKINEWLANERFILEDDFVELFNPLALPVALGGLYLSDSPGTPALHQIAPLSFVDAKQTIAFAADGDEQGRASHLNFKLASESGSIQLSDTNLIAIDVVNYGPQQTDVSQGRTPSGQDTYGYFSHPTPGGPNPGANSGQTNIAFTSRTLVALGATWKYNASGANLGTAWRAKTFADTAWSSGLAPFGLEPSSPYPYPVNIRTPLALTGPNGRIKTYYFRTHFDAGSDIEGVSLVATNYLDDGAVFYLNGNRVGALRVSDDPALYTSDAVNQPDEGQREIITFPSDSLVAGDNVLAVEVHQSGNASSDVVFAMALAAVKSTTNVISGDNLPVILSEVFARNQTITNIGGGISGWVELHNPGTNAVDLHELSLSDSSSNPRKWVFAPGSIVPAGGYLTVRFDTNHPASATNAGFALPWNGGTIYLFDRPERGGGIVDALTYGLQTPDFAVGRTSDGDGEWALTIPTENAPNVRAGLGSPGALRLNEWMADPISGPDWFEVYNPDAAPLALGGLAFTDDLNNPDKSVVPPLSFIGAGRNGFAQILADNNVNLGANHVAFRLGKGGSDLGIFAPSGSQIDALSFGSQDHGVSQGRLPDGTGPLTRFNNSSSPNAANYVVATPLDTDGDGMTDAWEDAHGLNKFANDADDDADGDGLTNLEEFQTGNDPQNSNSVLALDASIEAGGSVALRFMAVAGHSYLVQFTDDIAAGSWSTLREIANSGSDQTVEIHESVVGHAKRFFRVVLNTP